MTQRRGSISALIVIILLSACSSTGKVVAPVAPAWTTDRPILHGQYVGIGSAHKPATELEPGAALRTAKERAVADLASEISVRVESESLLESLSKNGVINERFQSSIRSSSDAHLEGYQLIDSYDDGTRIHVYYRLSKAEYAARRAAHKSSALEEAEAQLLAGSNALESGRLPLALSHFGDGLRALEPYIGEVIQIDRKIVRALRAAVTDLQISAQVQSVTLSTENSFAFPLALSVERPQAPDSTSSTSSTSSTNLQIVPLSPVRDVPLRYRYHNGTYMKQATEFTDGQGQVVALIADVEVDRPETSIGIEIDLPRLIEQSGLGPWGAILDGVVSPTLALPLEVVLPRIYVNCSEAALCASLRLALREGGHPLTEDKNEADILLSIEMEVRAGTISRGFHTAWASAQIVARRPGGHIVYEDRIPQLKGIQLDEASARAKAISNLSEQLGGATMRDLLRALH